MQADQKALLLLILLILFAPLPVLADAVHPDTEAHCNTVEFYYTQDCPHCRRASEYFSGFQQKYPGIDIKRFDIKKDDAGFSRFIKLNEQYEIDQPGVPFILLCDRYLVGFDEADTTGKEIEEFLGLSKNTILPTGFKHGQVKLPVLGTINVDQYGLPLFTIAIGLIDGFNPCAMWVLLFLLSLLLNLKNRARIIIVAGIFVLVSGLVYFAFMAAWLNLFLIIGFSRLLQVIVGLSALLIGSIHVKDYFAFKKGISLSIPETAKPGLYAHMRDVIYAHNLWASLVAVTILAILVNMIELVCTAGLPAVYTQILTSHDLSTINYYAYLVLYNLAYIFDDALMVTIVVITLSHSSLQEKTGRVLKFISGSVLVMLGTGLIFFPQLLV